MAELSAVQTLSMVILSEADWFRLDKLFHKVFGHSLDARLANYKYAGERGESLALVSEGADVVAHCGMTFRQLLVAGVPASGVQLGDLMVAPNTRGALSRRESPFYRVVAGALKRLDAAAVKPVLVFGFPSDRAMRVGERLGLFTEIDQISELIWAASQETLEAIAQPFPDKKFSDLVDRLWQKMAKDLMGAIVGVRNGDYFVRRYFQHPVHQYKVFVWRSRWLRVPLGVFVLRSHGAMIELVDWVAPLDQGDAVIEQACRAATCMGGESLMTWLTRSYAPRFTSNASSCEVTQFRIPACGQVPSEWAASFKNRVWLNAGDTDYR